MPGGRTGLSRWRSAALGGAVVLAAALTTTTGTAAPSQAELDRARERLLELEKDFELVVERYNLVHERLTRIQTQIAQTEEEVARIEDRMRVKQSAAVSLATELYKGGTDTTIAGLLSSETFADLDTGLYYLNRSERAQADIFEELSVIKDGLDAKLTFLDDARAEAADAQEHLSALREDIEDKLASQEDEIEELRAQIEAAERRAAQQAAAEEAAAVPPPTADVVAPAPAPNPRAQIAVESALSQVGKPYQWGGAGPNSYDCSGLTMWAWAQAGVSLPHNSGMQYSATPRVSQSDWAPGDLLFFGSPIHHVGMYIGKGQMVEAPYTGTTVRVGSAYRSDYVGAGRPGV